MTFVFLTNEYKRFISSSMTAAGFIAHGIEDRKEISIGKTMVSTTVMNYPV